MQYPAYHCEPKLAAKLAEGVYTVQNQRELKRFLEQDCFTQDVKAANLKASVGLRTNVLNTKAAFGLVTLGTKTRPHANTQVPNEVFIMFRGTTTTNYGADIFTDLRCGFDNSETIGLAHSGFNQAFKSMKTDIEQFLNGPGQHAQIIHVIGHSLGGAVATLCADWVKMKRTGASVMLYTFGAPRAGCGLFAASISDRLKNHNIHRVYHQNDPVTMVPIFPYMHPPVMGHGHYVERSGLVVSFAAHKMVNYINSCSRTEGGATKLWPELDVQHPQFKTKEQIKAWIKSDDFLDPFSSNTWSCLSNALTYVLEEAVKVVGTAILSKYQFMGSGYLTLADKMAQVLNLGLKALGVISDYIFKLMLKIAKALGISTNIQSKEELTELFMRKVLFRLKDKMIKEAKNAIRQIGNLR